MKTPAHLLRAWVPARAGEHKDWLEERLDALEAGAPDRDLHIVLGLIPRRLGRADLDLSPEDLAAAEAARPGWRPGGWSLDGAARVLALLVHRSERPFAERFKDLRRTADARELVALFRGLSLYPEPEALSFEAGEGLRSNMRAVFEAVAHDSPYPRETFDERRWNHMVLKALFVESRLAPIQGLDERANPDLARILREYAHERWSAGRRVSPELWRCVGPFAEDEAALADLERAAAGSRAEARAAALALAASSSPRAREILAGLPDGPAAAEGRIGWTDLEEARP